MKYDEKIYGSLGSIVTLLLLFLLLWFVSINTPYTPEEEGVMVSFGDSDDGGGQYTEEPASSPSESVSPPPAPAQPSDNDYMTQEDEQALALQKQREEEKKRKQQEEAERLKKQKEEEARLEAERIAQEKAIAEQKAREQAAIDKANQLGSLFGNSGSSQGANGDNSNSSGTKGNPAGHGNSGGNSWSLSGRDLKGTIGKPSLPPGTQSGVVVVSIRVNAAGKVISATQGQGTTISETATIRACIDKAYTVTFSAGEGDVIGNIKFNIQTN